MSQHGKALAILAFGVAIAVGGLAITRHMVAMAAEAESERLKRAILEHVARKNPGALIKAFQGFPEALLEEARRSNIDHCLALAQAEVESEFRHDAVGSAGEIGLFQIMPETAAFFETVVGRFRRPDLKAGKRDLGDLADPVVSTRIAMAYLRDILVRKPSLREALTEYNGGPLNRRTHYYRLVMGTYAEILENNDLRCRFQAVPPRLAPLLTFLQRA